MLLRSLFSSLAFGGITLVCPFAQAFVSSSVGGHPGELDVSFKVGLESGKIEPNENMRSWQRANQRLYTLGVGYTFGDVGPLEDAYLRLDATHFQSPAEVNDLARGAVTPTQCAGRVLADDRCEFYPQDQGGLFTPTIGANLVHTGSFSFGLYLQGTIPVDVDLAKFSNPRVDYIAGGTQLGVHITPWFAYEARTFVGSGTLGGAHRQNAGVAVTNLFVFEAHRWILPWGAGIKIGPYFDGDLSERFDARYDLAFSRKDLPGDPGDRVRSLRFALAILPYFRITESAGVELGYVQKAFGYDAIATKYFFATVRLVFSPG